MSSEDAEIPGPGRTRARLVERAQERYYRAKSAYLRAGMLSADSDAITTAVAELHTAVFQYYWAVKPLSDDDNIAQQWGEKGDTTDDKIVLWTEQVPATDEQGRPILQQGENGKVYQQTREVPVGLPEVERFAVDVSREVETVEGMLGTREREVSTPNRLPPETLIEIGDALDDLADDLGFRPETPRHEPETEVTQDDLRELEQKWAGEIDALDNVEES